MRLSLYTLHRNLGGKNLQLCLVKHTVQQFSASTALHLVYAKTKCLILHALLTFNYKACKIQICSSHLTPDGEKHCRVIPFCLRVEVALLHHLAACSGLMISPSKALRHDMFKKMHAIALCLPIHRTLTRGSNRRRGRERWFAPPEIFKPCNTGLNNI